jgi:hypothetical protein
MCVYVLYTPVETTLLDACVCVCVCVRVCVCVCVCVCVLYTPVETTLLDACVCVCMCYTHQLRQPYWMRVYVCVCVLVLYTSLRQTHWMCVCTNTGNQHVTVNKTNTNNRCWKQAHVLAIAAESQNAGSSHCHKRNLETEAHTDRLIRCPAHGIEPP